MKLSAYDTKADFALFFNKEKGMQLTIIVSCMPFELTMNVTS